MKSIGKILVLMYAITAVLLFLLALLLKQFQWGTQGIQAGITMVYVITCLIGGIFAGKVQRSKKFIWGILVSLMYIIVMLILTLIIKDGFHGESSVFVTNLLLGMGSGMVGGMLA